MREGRSYVDVRNSASMARGDLNRMTLPERPQSLSQRARAAVSAPGRVRAIQMAIWIAALSSTVHAQTTTVWTGAVSNDATDSANWSSGVPTPSSNAVINTNTNAALLDIPAFASELEADTLQIGTGAGSNGSLTMVFPTTNEGGSGVTGYISAETAIQIGANGGVGALTFTNVPSAATETSLSYSRLSTPMFSLGTGGGTGTLTITGYGKNVQTTSAAEGIISILSLSAPVTGNPTIGGGGTGVIAINGGGLSLGSDGTSTYSSVLFGTGAGGVAQVSILAGGKLLVGGGELASSAMTAIFGSNGGQGTLVVDNSPASTNTANAQSTATFFNGLTLGMGVGARGAMSVLAGGKVLSYPTISLDPSEAPASPVQLGVNGGEGTALVSGAGSIWYVAGPSTIDGGGPLSTPGELFVGVSGQGTLTIADGGKVDIGQAEVGYSGQPDGWIRDWVSGTGTLFLAENAGSAGTLNIGDAPGAAPQASGTLAAAEIVIGAGTGTINFNITDTDYQFTVPVSGTGTIANYAGTTWLAADNSGFSGSTNLYGGTLGLSNDNSVGTSTIFGLGNSTLAYADGVNIANAMQIASGVTVNLQSTGTATQAGVISGAGGIGKTGAGELILNNVNTYTGLTDIAEGTLALQGSGSIANSVEVRNNAALDVSGASGDVHVVTLSGSGTTELGASTLVLTNSGSNGAGSGTYSGVMSGTGVLQQLAGTEVLSGANTYSGGTLLDGGTLVVGNDAALGTGTLAMAPGTTLDFNGDYTVANQITLTGDPTINVNAGLSDTLTGSISDGASPGTLDKTGGGTLTLANLNTYTGATNVMAGTLRAGAAGAFSTASAFSVANGALLDLNGISQTVASLTNSGMVNVSTNANTILTVSGNYTGNNGVLGLSTVLGDDSSPTDLLHVRGNTSGSTALVVTNAGGLGGDTLGNGIKVVQVDGASNGVFTQGARVEAGAYQYLLYKGGLGADSTDGNWYLRSHDEGPQPGPDPSPDPGPIAWRPGVVGYVMTPALNVSYGFSTLGTLVQRVGDVPGAVVPNSANRDGIWGRIGGGSLDADAFNRFSASGRTFFAQFGKDWTLAQPSEGGSTHAGATFTIGQMSADFDDSARAINGFSTHTGNVATQAQSIGGYWTRYLKDGTYFDSVGQITHYHNRYGDIEGDSPGQDGFGVALSQEVGKAFQIANSPIAIEPQAQLMYQYLRLGSFSDSISPVSGTSSNALRGRLGFRIFHFDMKTADGKNSATPWVSLSVVHDFLPTAQTVVGETPFSPDLGRTWYDLGVGVTASFGKHGELYTNFGYSHNMGGGYRQSLYGQAGYRYSW